MDGFLSYRVWSDKDLTEKLFYALERAGYKIYWDKVCLQPGAPWASISIGQRAVPAEPHRGQNN